MSLPNGISWQGSDGYGVHQRALKAVTESSSFHRPRISRETRRLLFAALLALLALWMLAQARFTGDDRPRGHGAAAARPNHGTANVRRSADRDFTRAWSSAADPARGADGDPHARRCRPAAGGCDRSPTRRHPGRRATAGLPAPPAARCRPRRHRSGLGVGGAVRRAVRWRPAADVVDAASTTGAAVSAGHHCIFRRRVAAAGIRSGVDACGPPRVAGSALGGGVGNRTRNRFVCVHDRRRFRRPGHRRCRQALNRRR